MISSEDGSVLMKAEGQVLIILTSGVGDCDTERFLREDPGPQHHLQLGVIGSEVEYCLVPRLLE